MRTDEAIKTDIYKYIAASELKKAVTGKVSKRKRPHNSTKEDIVISILANENGQIQIATVNVNIYVADIAVDNQPEEDTVRLEELGSLASSLFDVFWGPDSEYRASLLSQRVFEADGTDEHIINNKIEVKYLNE
ncbi:MAG: hypothetical protein IJ064_05490 [Bacteroidaceae bacterium]|nr:hypothetical protein [Bacteroidaceae bacterium]